MNESSSKFVDQIATEKLIENKLKKVSHTVEIPEDLQGKQPFGDFNESIEPDGGMTATAGHDCRIISFPSVIQTEYNENNRCDVYVYDAVAPQGDVIIVHGLYEDNLQIYSALIEALKNRNFTVHLMTLPFHYRRKPATSKFSGEYFLSANVRRSLLAIKQGMYDLHAYRNHIKKRSGRGLMVSAFSMGGAVVMLLTSISRSADRVFLINPVCQLSMNIWERPLFSTIKKDFSRHGYGYSEVQRFLSGYEPLTLCPKNRSIDAIALAYGEYDQINDVNDYRRITNKWRFRTVYPYKAGHLNLLRVPKLAMDMADFYRSEIPASVVQ
jgi:hypothetical protein